MPCGKQGSFYKFKISSDAGEVENKDAKAKDLWGGFKEQTTAHGIPHVDQARGFCKVSFWLVVSLICFGALIGHLYYITSLYLSFKVDVVVALAHERELTFPSVTICNMNPVKLSNLSLSPQLDTLLSASRRRRRSAWYNDADDPDLAQGQVLRRSRRSTDDVESRAFEILAELNETTKRNMGYELEEFILDCQYAGSNCHMDEFVRFFDPNYGNCYMFNSEWRTANNLHTSKRAGRRHGLKFVLNVKQDEYVDALSQGAGARVVIHSQERMPFPSDEGVLTTPGQITSIGMRQVYIHRESYPYGNCTDENKRNISRNVYEEKYNVKYSSNACYKTCYQKYVIADCGCADPQFPLGGRALGSRLDAAVCEADDEDQSDCKDRVSRKYQNNELDCSCPTQCEETAYSFEVSNVQWPSDVHEQTVLETYGAQAPEILAANDTSTKLRRNLIKAEVYFQEFNYETMVERPSYAWASFASDIGGILGLWLGLSILSAFEFFELGVDFIVLMCMKCCRKKDPINPDSDSPPPPYSAEGRNRQTTKLGSTFHNAPGGAFQHQSEESFPTQKGDAFQQQDQTGNTKTPHAFQRNRIKLGFV